MCEDAEREALEELAAQARDLIMQPIEDDVDQLPE